MVDGLAPFLPQLFLWFTVSHGPHPSCPMLSLSFIWFLFLLGCGEDRNSLEDTVTEGSFPSQWGGCWNLPVERLPGGRRWLRSSWNVCPRALCPPHTWLSWLCKVKQAAPQRLWSSLTLLGSLIPPLSRSVRLRGHFTSECHFPVQWA